jgi:hypothetical protein
MCSLCYALAPDHWSEARSNARARAARVHLANRVLGHFGLSLRDWARAWYVVADAKGKSTIARDLGSVWLAAEQTLGRPLSPLDSELIAALGNTVE